MSAQAGPGPSSSAYLQAQKQPGNNANTTSTNVSNGGPSLATNTANNLAPIGGTVENVAPGEPNTFTDAQLEEFKEQDRYLPIANVGRIMKNALPSNAKIAKEAKECVQECVSEYISFLSSEAADKVGIDKRKTINGEDILYAMTALGFDNYQEAGRVYLAKYRNYINEHPHRPSHHDRTVPPSAQTSNRNTPLQTPAIADDLYNMPVFLNQPPDDGFSGNFNAFVNDDLNPGGDDDDDDEDADAEAGSGPFQSSDTGGKGKPKKAPAAGKKAPGGGAKRKGAPTGAGPPEKKAKTKAAGATTTTAAGKKGGKK